MYINRKIKVGAIILWIVQRARQGSHSHGKSGKVVEKHMVMESHGKIMGNKQISKVMEK